MALIQHIFVVVHVYLAEPCEALFIFRWAATVAWVFKVQIEAVEAAFPQEIDGSVDELLPVGFGGQHGGHGACTEVPSSHSQHHLQLRVHLLDVHSPLIPRG